METILKIRRYVFVKLVYHWLSKIYNVNEQKPIEVPSDSSIGRYPWKV